MNRPLQTICLICKVHQHTNSTNIQRPMQPTSNTQQTEIMQKYATIFSIAQRIHQVLSLGNSVVLLLPSSNTLVLTHSIPTSLLDNYLQILRSKSDFLL